MVKVLLTGGSGFIAAHVLETLLKRGHKVVTTVRSHDKGKFLLNAHKGTPSDTLSYTVVEDIAAEGAFNEAVKSSPPFDAVIHTASPFFHGHTDPVKELLDPAIKGTTGVLKAIKAYAPSVKHVVITSSFAAIANPHNPPKVYNEDSWNPVTKEEALQPTVTYRASKTFAERAAWDFVRDEKPNFTLTTINPPLVIGPVIHYFNTLDALNTSNHRTRDIVLGKYKDGIEPSKLFIWVDVRDVALAHVLAVEKPEAAGKRFFVVEGYFSNKRIVDAVRETHPELKDRLPAEDAPEDFPKEIFGVDNSRSKEILGLQYRSLKESISDTVDSIKAAGGL